MKSISRLLVVASTCACVSIVLAQPAPAPATPPPSSGSASTTTTGSPAPAGSGATTGSGSGAGSGGNAGSSAGSGNADADKGIPDLDELRPPTSPAFSLLGVSPTEIDRPRTPSALMASLGSAFAQTLPSSLAIEFAPYWLADHSTLSLKTFSKPDDARAWFMRMLSSVSINLATNKATLPMDQGGSEYTDLSTGVYVVPVRGWDSSACDKLANGPQVIDETMAKAKTGLAKTMQETSKACPNNIVQRDNGFAYKVENGFSATFKTRDEAVAACDDAAAADFQKAVTELTTVKIAAQDSLEKEHKKKIEACEKAFWTPSGFVVSAAFATAWRFSDSKWSEHRYLRTGLWTSAGYEGERLTLLALARLQWESAGHDGAAPDLFDAGGRFIIHRNSFAASVEGVHRWGLASGLGDGWRLALVGEMPIKGSWLSVSIGKGYDSTKDGSFFALANLSITMGDPQLQATDPKPSATTQ